MGCEQSCGCSEKLEEYGERPVYATRTHSKCSADLSECCSTKYSQQLVDENRELKIKLRIKDTESSTKSKTVIQQKDRIQQLERENSALKMELKTLKEENKKRKEEIETLEASRKADKEQQQLAMKEIERKIASLKRDDSNSS